MTIHQERYAVCWTKSGQIISVVPFLKPETTAPSYVMAQSLVTPSWCHREVVLPRRKGMVDIGRFLLWKMRVHGFPSWKKSSMATQSVKRHRDCYWSHLAMGQFRVVSRKSMKTQHTFVVRSTMILQSNGNFLLLCALETSGLIDYCTVSSVI